MGHPAPRRDEFDGDTLDRSSWLLDVPVDPPNLVPGGARPPSYTSPVSRPGVSDGSMVDARRGQAASMNAAAKRSSRWLPSMSTAPRVGGIGWVPVWSTFR